MNNLVERLFGGSKRFAIPLHVDPVGEALSKRLTPDQLASIQSELSVSAMRASSNAAGQQPVTPTSRPGAQPATVSTTLRSSGSTFSAAPSYTVGQPLSQAPTTTSRVTSSSSSSSSSTSSSTSSTPSPTSSPASTLPPVITRTLSASSSSSSASTVPTVASDASTAGSSSSGLSTGAVVGVVLAVLVGVVILGSLLGWAYRKFTQRNYERSQPWRKLEDDVTPFPMEKDDRYQDDVYGGAAVPVIGSRRELADRADAYSARPDSTFMLERGQNRAGWGAGAADNGEYGFGAGGSGGYPAHPAYGVDAQGRPYNGQAGRVPVPHMYNQQTSPYPEGPHSHQYSPGGSPPPGSRQLVGPPLAPVALGRPPAPQTYNDISSREDYGDEPLSAGLAYTEPYSPVTARSMDQPAHSMPQGVQRPPPGIMQQQQDQARMAATKAASPPMSHLHPQPLPLPAFAPLSPLSSSFDLASQPVGMQKQLYGEVSQAAGFPEPITPHSATMNSNSSRSTEGLDDSFKSMMTTSSFSATEHGMRLPPPPALPRINVNAPAPLSMPNPNPPQPYEHGRPLSPLTELPTPSTISSMPVPIASSSIGHTLRDEPNPFDRLPLPTPSPSAPGRNLTAPPPMSAASWNSIGSMGPSPRYPPPSPGGMSVPGSVGDSPKRWSGGNGNMVRRSRGESMFDEDDAYGGI